MAPFEAMPYFFIFRKFEEIMAKCMKHFSIENSTTKQFGVSYAHGIVC
jgi:hypothetical protein